MSDVTFPLQNLIGVLIGADLVNGFNQAIRITSSNYAISRVVFTDVSGGPCTGMGGVFATTGFTTPLTTSSSFGALLASTDVVKPPLATAATTRRRTETTIYFSMTIAGEDPPTTANIYVYGDRLT